MGPSPACMVCSWQQSFALHLNSIISLKQLGFWLVEPCNMLPVLHSQIGDIMSLDEALCYMLCYLGCPVVSIASIPMGANEHLTYLLDIYWVPPALNVIWASVIYLLPQTILVKLHWLGSLKTHGQPLCCSWGVVIPSIRYSWHNVVVEEMSNILAHVTFV